MHEEPGERDFLEGLAGEAEVLADEHNAQLDEIAEAGRAAAVEEAERAVAEHEAAELPATMTPEQATEVTARLDSYVAGDMERNAAAELFKLTGLGFRLIVNAGLVEIEPPSTLSHFRVHGANAVGARQELAIALTEMRADLMVRLDYVEQGLAGITFDAKAVADATIPF